MAYQNLFKALQNVCGFTALESDMFEVINAYEKDKAEQLPQAPVSKSLPPTLREWLDCNVDSMGEYANERFLTETETARLIIKFALEFATEMENRDTYLEKKTVNDLVNEFVGGNVC